MFAGEPDKSIEYVPPGEGTAPLAAAPNPPATEPAAPSVPAMPDIAEPNGPAPPVSAVGSAPIAVAKFIGEEGGAATGALAAGVDSGAIAVAKFMGGSSQLIPPPLDAATGGASAGGWKGSVRTCAGVADGAGPLPIMALT